ncbi:MAG: hypothetical protein ACYC3G_03335 [Minisyncoccota bacterium]
MKNKPALIVGVLASIYFVYAVIFSGMAAINESAFSWITVINLFIPLILLVLLFIYFFTKQLGDVKVIKKRLLALYVLVIMISFWIFAPIENYFLLSISGKEIAIQTFSYLWETLLLGSLAVFIFMKLFKPIDNFLINYESNIEKITPEEAKKVSEIATKFPLRTAIIVPFMTILGYIIGSIQFYLVNPSIHYLVIINNLLISLAVGPIIFLAIYFFTHRILKDTNNIFYTFGDITSPNKVLGFTNKILFFGSTYGMFFILIFIGLLINLSYGGIGMIEFYYGLGINFIFTLIIMLFVGNAISRDIIFSLLEIKKGLEIIRGGNYNYQINIKTGDEAENVAYEFNKTMHYLKKDQK